MIRGIHHVAIHVNDLDRMIRFYREAFNFELHRPPFDWADEKGMDLLMDVNGTSGRQAVLRAGNCYLELFQFNTPSPNSKQPLRPNDKGYTHFCVDVTDIEVEFERLKGVGMVFGHSAPVDMGIMITIYGRDPEGNIIEIQQAEPHCDVRLEDLKPAA